MSRSVTSGMTSTSEMASASIHPNALCESTQIGPGTRICAFAHILPGARIGADCNIHDGVFVDNNVLIGDRVTVRSGVQLWDGIQLDDDVFVGPNVTFASYRFPPGKQDPEPLNTIVIHHGACIGGDATILPGTVIGAGAIIGAGAVVTRSVPSNAIVAGNPARVAGYVDPKQKAISPLLSLSPAAESPSVVPIGVGRATLHHMRTVSDVRGSLSFGEFGREIPFTAQRYFMVFDVPSREVRGEHAHRSCEQFLICVRGNCDVLLDDGRERCELTLDRANLGIYVPPMIWGAQYRYSADAVLLVFASQYYELMRLHPQLP